MAEDLSTLACWIAQGGTYGEWQINQTLLNNDMTKVDCGPIEDSCLTMTSGVLLGRSTAEDGPIEDITVGSGLDLTGGVLTASGGSSAWVVKSANYQSVNGDLLLADTTGGAFTITLPLAPAVGDVVEFSDAQGTWGTNNMTVARNGELIMGAASNLVSNVTGANFGLVFADGATGWRVLQ